MTSLLSKFSVNNVFAGFIVAVVALPLCIAFAIASGANPIAGVVSGVVGGFLAAAFGSSKFQVSGPAAAFITIIYGIIAQHGFPALLASTFIAGLVLLAIALLRLGKIMELMPHSIIVGFTTGIGILILLGQLPVALGIEAKGQDIIDKLTYTGTHLSQASLFEPLVLLATLGASLGWARTRLAKWLPAPLIALLAGTLVAQALLGFGIPIRTIGALYDVSLSSLSLSGDFLGALLTEHAPILLAGLTLGFLIAIESLLSSKALDQMTNTSHDPDRELVGLGIANLAVPFLGGIPVSGVIVRGSTNVMSGATERTSAMLHAIFLGLFIAALYAYIKLLPMAALAAVLMLTARRLIEMPEIRRILHIDRWEGGLVVLTVVLTVAIDLTVSVPLGVALMLVLALRRMIEDKRLDVVDQHEHSVVAVNTSITFLTAAALRKDMEDHLRDGRVRVLNLTGMHFVDSTGAVMLAGLMQRHPQLSAWVSNQRKFDKLSHAGVAEARLTIVGSRMVNLPEVFRGIEGAAA